MKNLLYLLGIFIGIGLVAGCASIGTPGGGARDEDPPRLVRANPPQGALEVTTDRITLDFNEIVNVKDAFTNVVMSPSAKSAPRVSSSGRRVTIQLPDSLAPNTTYTIDFGKSIEDNNEGNPLQGFSYSFSTGPELDTLRVAGIVLGAQDLEPAQGIFVGLYPSTLPDSVFLTDKMSYIARTDDRGRFIVRGLKADTYRLVALKDNDNDYRYANPEEDIAFLRSFVSPSTVRTVVSDTILNLKTGEVDTVVDRERTVYLPNTLLLRSFNTGKRTQYLSKYERPDSMRITLLFNTAADTLPTFSLPGHDMSGLVVERSATNDTITYWLPSRLATLDTLRASVAYLRPDSTGVLAPTTDSLNFIYKRPKVKPPKSSKSKKKEETRDSILLPETPKLSWSMGGSSSNQEVWRPLEINFSHPLERFDTASFKLEQKVDTIWRPARGKLQFERFDSLNPSRAIFSYPWESGVSYRLLADSASAVSLYGEVLDKINQEFSTKPLEEYATFRFRIEGLPDSVPAFVEFLNGTDKAVRKSVVEDGVAFFRYLEPGKYYVRITLDENGDGVWTPGDYITGLQPDEAFYYPKQVTVKKNWDYDQSWDLWAIAVDLQKPEAVKKNKPDRDKRDRLKKNNEEEEEEDEEDEFGANLFDPSRNNGNRSGTRLNR